MLRDFAATTNGTSIGRLGGSDFEALAYSRLRKREPGKFLSHVYDSRGLLLNHISRAMQLNGFFVKDPKNLIQEYNAYLDEIESSSRAVKANFYAGKSLIDYVDRGLPYWAGEVTLALSSGRPISNYGVVERAAPFLESIKGIFEGGKLLVVSPFSRSVQLQVVRGGETVVGFGWPEFELQTVTTPVTYSSLRSKVSRDLTWAGELRRVRDAVLNTEFDLALLACGSYANPLAASIQAAGKKSIYIGGMLNVFFALDGGRFSQAHYLSQMNAGSRLRPLEASEISKAVQGAGYTRKFEAIRAYLPEELTEE
jgi:hypothetical protein